MRLVVLLTAASVVTAAAAMACSSSPPQAASNTQNDTSANDPGTASAAPAPAPAPAAPAPATTASDAGTVTAIDPDAGSAVVPVQTTSAACIPGSTPETEPNNDPATANTIPATTGSFCGHLEPGDIDVVKFTMPQITPGHSLQFGSGLDFASGPLNVQGFVGGQSFDFFSNDWPFIPGQTYIFQISAASALPVDYRIPFTFQTF